MTKENVCEIWIVRHGQTVANMTGVLQGQHDSPLDETGLAQVEAVGERLRDKPFDLVYSSDLGRTLHTMKIINSKRTHAMEVIAVKSLREWNLGELEGKSYPFLLREYPEIMRRFKQDVDDIQVPGGESQSEFQTRLGSFMNEAARANLGKRILMITHGGALQCIFRHCFGRPSDNNSLALADNASLSCFHYSADPGTWRLVTWNDCAHLSHLQIKSTLSY